MAVVFGAAGNTPSKNEVGRTPFVADVAQRAACDVFAAETADYTLTNLEFRCVSYHMGPEFTLMWLLLMC